MQATGSEIYGHDLMKPDLIRAEGSQICGHDSIARTGTRLSNLGRRTEDQRPRAHHLRWWPPHGDVPRTAAAPSPDFRLVRPSALTSTLWGATRSPEAIELGTGYSPVTRAKRTAPMVSHNPRTPTTNWGALPADSVRKCLGLLRSNPAKVFESIPGTGWRRGEVFAAAWVIWVSGRWFLTHAQLELRWTRARVDSGDGEAIYGRERGLQDRPRPGIVDPSLRHSAMRARWARWRRAGRAASAWASCDSERAMARQVADTWARFVSGRRSAPVTGVQGSQLGPAWQSVTRAVERDLGHASGMVSWARSEAASPFKLEFFLYFPFYFEFPFSKFKTCYLNSKLICRFHRSCAQNKYTSLRIYLCFYCYLYFILLPFLFSPFCHFQIQFKFWFCFKSSSH
jgi:hypothetical protein